MAGYGGPTSGKLLPIEPEKPPRLLTRSGVAVRLIAWAFCLAALFHQTPVLAQEAKTGPTKAQTSTFYKKGVAALKRRDVDSALEAFLNGADAGDLKSASAAGRLLYSGTRVSRDRRRACELFEQAAKGGVASAMHNLAMCYYKGEQGRQDYSLSAKWFRRGADAGYKPALCALGSQYLNGQGVKQNRKKAFALCHEAAVAGNANAQTDVARMYLSGSGTKRDPAEGAKWLVKAAAKRHANANRLLALQYLKGEGVPRDLKKTQTHLVLAARYGNRLAPYVLGQLYYGTAKDPKIKKASDGILYPAMFWMAIAAKVEPGCEEPPGRQQGIPGPV